VRIDHVIVERVDGGHEQKINDGGAHFLEGAGGWR
jgi:hypothetical protein